MQKYEESINTFKSLIDIEPENPWAWHQIGLDYKELQMYQKAVESFDNALDVDPNFVLGYLEKGVTLGLNKQYSEAMKCFDEVLLKDPKNPDALQFKKMTIEFMDEKNQE